MSGGNNFEYEIDKLIEYLNNNGLAFGWKNHANRLHNGKYISGEPFDYNIVSENYSCFFDAKETKSNKWIMQPKDIKQYENLKRLYSYGFDTFFLIYFYERKKYYKLSIINMIPLRKKTWYPEEMENNFKLEKMFA